MADRAMAERYDRAMAAKGKRTHDEATRDDGRQARAASKRTLQPERWFRILFTHSQDLTGSHWRALAEASGQLIPPVSGSSEREVDRKIRRQIAQHFGVTVPQLKQSAEELRAYHEEETEEDPDDDLDELGMPSWERAEFEQARRESAVAKAKARKLMRVAGEVGYAHSIWRRNEDAWFELSDRFLGTSEHVLLVRELERTVRRWRYTLETALLRGSPEPSLDLDDAPSTVRDKVLRCARIAKVELDDLAYRDRGLSAKRRCRIALMRFLEMLCETGFQSFPGTTQVARDPRLRWAHLMLPFADSLDPLGVTIAELFEAGAQNKELESRLFASWSVRKPGRREQGKFKALSSFMERLYGERFNPASLKVDWSQFGDWRS
jgi:hypothetical protein